MKRFLKWFFGIVLFLIVIVVGLAISLPYLIDPNEYKADIIAQIKPHMRGRDLQIPGDIKISVIPWLGFEVGEMVVGNADGFVLKPFMTIDQSKAHVKLLSLLSDTPQIGSLEFRGIKVYLQRDAEGRNNWSDLANAAAAKPAPKPSAATSAMAIPLLKVQGLQLDDITVWFDDKQNKDMITLSSMSLEAGPIDRLQPVPIKGKFNLHSKKNELAAASAFATTLVLEQNTSQLKFDNLVMNTNVSGQIVNNNTIRTSLRVPELNIDTDKEKIIARPFHLKINDTDSEGRLTMTRFDNPIVRLGWEIAILDLDALIPGLQGTKASAANEDIPQVAAINTGEEVDNTAKLLAPLAAFSNSDLQGTIKIGHLRVKQLDFKDFKANLLARSGLVSALPEATVYGGTYKGDLQVQTKTVPMRLRTKQQLENVPIGPILKALYGKESATGNIYFQGQYFSEGQTQKALTQHLHGDGQFNIKNAKLKAQDVKQLMLGKWYDKAKFVQEKEEDREVTAFDFMRGTLRIKSGVVFNRDFNAMSRRLELRGDGFVNLNDGQIKYTMTSIPKKSMAFSLAGHNYELKDRHIQTHITGTLAEPKIDNDVEQIFKDEFKQSELYQKKRAEEEKIKGKLKDKLRDLLKK